ncbi:MAG: N-acetylmuramoyl-L-alanine amidase [Clostridia bacterium]|nr:N-acetylmuramoyl-L-alanine amidase [Clostridia bacterium]
MFKLALSAGHSNSTKRGCPKSLDPNGTNEWVLNNRIVAKMEKILEEYDGIEVLRLDDRTGEQLVELEERTDAANKWGADFYLAIHHNGGINGGKGGGIVAYAHPKASAASFEWQKALYDAAVASTGLRGNRSTPLARKNLHEVREPKCPAVLMECGFMDSATDCPIILTEDFADKIAQAFCDVIVERSGVQKKSKKPLYLVQSDVFGERENAEIMLAALERAGFDGFRVVKIEYC